MCRVAVHIRNMSKWRAPRSIDASTMAYRLIGSAFAFFEGPQFYRHFFTPSQKGPQSTCTVSRIPMTLPLAWKQLDWPFRHLGVETQKFYLSGKVAYPYKKDPERLSWTLQRFIHCALAACRKENVDAIALAAPDLDFLYLVDAW
jgi:hypothetical protein